MSKTIREVLVRIWNQECETGMEIDQAITQALAEIEGIVVPSVEEIMQIIEKEFRKGNPNLHVIYGGKIAQAIHAMLKERIR